MSGIDGSKSISSDLQKSGNKEQQYKSEQSNLDKIEIELPIEQNNLNQSKTFDNVSFNVSAKEEPLTMRDLEMIEQNKNKQSEDNSELMLPKVETEI